MTDYIDLAPNPTSLIESLRSIGYSFDSAIADIFDNSIAASARNITVDFEWNSGDPWLAISDNGTGMTKNELINAMRFGSMNPLAERKPNDLGRFGLGLKTASFSQCRHLTVLSKKDSEITCCEWDLNRLSLDDSNGWKLGIIDFRKADLVEAIYRTNLSTQNTGTIVLLQDIDRPLEKALPASQEKFFDATLNSARNHLELVYHRFLIPDPGYQKLWISMNGDELVGFNPFNPRNIATQELQEQIISLDGQSIKVQPYILPHHNKVSREEYEKFSGEGGYLNNQGFYVYRNRRLIIKGTWFKLLRKEELNKLIRVRVDIPNSLDHLWKIDIKKSQAYPPENIREELRKVIGRIEFSGKRVYKQKGKKLKEDITTPIWNRIASAGSITYKINREHPLITIVLNYYTQDHLDLLENLFATIESDFPVDLMYQDVASNPEKVEVPGFNIEKFGALLNLFIDNWLSAGIQSEEIPGRALSTDPFAAYRDLTINLLVQRGYSCE